MKDHSLQPIPDVGEVENACDLVTDLISIDAEYGHPGRAAEALRLSQSALSKSLRRLEQEVRAKLVKRTPKGDEMTAEGSTLLSRVRRLQKTVTYPPQPGGSSSY